MAFIVVGALSSGGCLHRVLRGRSPYRADRARRERPNRVRLLPSACARGDIESTQTRAGNTARSRTAYFAALRSLIDCAARHAAEAWDIDMVRCVTAAIAAVKGQVNLAAVLTDLPVDVIERIDEDMIDKMSSLDLNAE